MTSDRDSILKSWLETLRFSIEYYEDTFESGRENNSAKNMTSSPEDDEIYVNIWDCSLSARNANSANDPSQVRVNKTGKKPVATPRASKTSEAIYENLQPKTDTLTILEEPIYENLPLTSRTSTPIYENLHCNGSIDSLKLEEEVFQTIQYLENVIGVADAESEDFDLDEIPVNDKEFTDSSSSFGEFINPDNSPNLLSLHQRYAKENRVSALIEEPEPGLDPELKLIPKPKTMTIDRKKRYSVPFNNHTKITRRPHSFDGSLCDFCSEKSEEKNLCFATENTISQVFQNEEVQDLHPVLSDTKKEEPLVKTLKEDVIFWIALLMSDCIGECDVLEEKELLKSFSDASKAQSPRPQFSKFPIDDSVAIRNDPDIRRNRRSKTTDFDVAGKKYPGTTHLKNFEVRGLIKIEFPSRNTLDRVFYVKDDYLIYENEALIRYEGKTRKREILCQNVVLKSVERRSTLVELRDTKNECYILKFQKLDAAKKFMENDQVLEYITDNKVGLMYSLRKLLGKRASQEYLEKKGIYKPEPFFGNTLKDITNCTNQLVPAFVTETIKLLERPENIKSLGLYRTSGNLATIQKIRLEVDKNNLNILNEYSKDPDVLTGSLKLFFRELKEPLITHEICDKLLQCTKQNPDTFTAKDHQKIRSILINNLHESNLETFVILMRHLLEVVKYKEHNKMDSYNLAVCWGPSMVFNVAKLDENPTIESCRDIVCLSQSATRMVDFFLTYYEQYPAELGTLGKRMKLDMSEKMHTLRRQESRESDWSLDSSRSSQKKSGSNLSLSIDEVIKSLVDYIQPHIHFQQLYRKPGSSDKTNKIMKKLNKKKIKELEKYKNDVPELTDALRKYLKDHDSLITDDAVESVLKITSDYTENYLKPTLRHQVMSKIEETPKKDTLIFLLRHLADVVKSQEDAKQEVIKSWALALYKPKKNKVSVKDVEKFLSVAIKAFNDDLPDVVRSSFENGKGSSPIKNMDYDEVLKEIKHHQNEQAGRDRNSRYDNVDSDDNFGDVGEASILDDDKTEQTKL